MTRTGATEIITTIEEVEKFVVLYADDATCYEHIEKVLTGLALAKAAAIMLYVSRPSEEA